ncbi:PEP-CTERM sorting domain-containing protein [Cerasicoccus frondis]|uniref:PEP-CTERM sorting domain-containing protein n=1 Tax=Cerasicoccus frondis TaxID=490090 RepID=UPI0028528D71|nr:PEP-CTERM sorting domain-containing protein [Cerasicoccus frondis]
MSGVVDGGPTGIPVTAIESVQAGISLAEGLQLGSGLKNKSGDPVDYEIATSDYTRRDGSELAEAIAGNKYVTFSITVDEGYTLDLTTITFGIRRNGSGAPDDYAILSSISGFTDSDALATLNTASTSAEAFSADTTSNSAFQTIAGGTTVEFRLYGWNANVDSSNTHITGASIDGTITAVPEPSTLALFAGIAALGVVAYRRRKRCYAR